MDKVHKKQFVWVSHSPLSKPCRVKYLIWFLSDHFDFINQLFCCDSERPFCICTTETNVIGLCVYVTFKGTSDSNIYKCTGRMMIHIYINSPNQRTRCPWINIKSHSHSCYINKYKIHLSLLTDMIMKQKIGGY